MRRRAALAVAVSVVALALGGCGGDDGDEATATPSSPAQVESPSGGAAAPPSAAGPLPPQFIDCMAEQGYAMSSPADVHSAPPEVLQMCFGSLHGGGGAP